MADAKQSEATKVTGAVDEPKKKSSEQLALREEKGSKDDLIAKINKSSASDHRKAFLVAELNALEGNAFVMDTHIHAAHPGEVLGHFHIKKIF